MDDIVRVLRIVEYEGPRRKVEEQIRNSLHGTKYFFYGDNKKFKDDARPLRITAVTLNEFPVVLEKARTVEDKREDI